MEWIGVSSDNDLRPIFTNLLRVRTGSGSHPNLGVLLWPSFQSDMFLSSLRTNLLLRDATTGTILVERRVSP